MRVDNIISFGRCLMCSPPGSLVVHNNIPANSARTGGNVCGTWRVILYDVGPFTPHRWRRVVVNKTVSNGTAKLIEFGRDRRRSVYGR